MSEFTTTISRFDDLFLAARQVYWAWAEAEPFVQDDHKARLADILSGIAVGRLKVAVARNRTIDIAVPAHHAPERLPPTFLIGLTVVVTADWLWATDSNQWLRGSMAAQALSARLQLECPHACGQRFASQVAEIARSNGERRRTHWIEREFGKPR